MVSASRKTNVQKRARVAMLHKRNHNPDHSRDYNKEYADLNNRQYAYDFDYILRDYMIRQLSPLFPKGAVLEMGCYKGEFTKKLISFFDDITVIEAASELVDECKQKLPNNISFINQCFEETQLDKKFDAVFLVHTLEHLDDPGLVLKKINHWLTPNGKLFLVVPNANAASRQIAVKMDLISHNTAVTEGEKAHGHRCSYTLDTLYRDATQSGLDVIQQGGIFFKPFANFQFDRLIAEKIIDRRYLDGCYQLGMQYPELCASIFVVCKKGENSE